MTIPEELRSVPSNESSYSTDELVRTLDYLGLDDSSILASSSNPLHIGSSAAGPLHSASHGTLESLRSDFEQHHHLASPGRLRANTVAAAPRREPLVRRTSPLFRSDDRQTEVSTPATTPSADPTRLLYSTGHVGQKQYPHYSQGDSSASTIPDPAVSPTGAAPGSNGASVRPRASTIGILDESSQAFLRGRARAGTSLGIAPSLFRSSTSSSLRSTQEQLQTAAANGHGSPVALASRFSSSNVIEEVIFIIPFFFKSIRAC
jgi:hypothetical protein